MEETFNPDDLIISYLTRQLSNEEFLQLKKWVNQSKKNSNYFFQYCDLWMTSKMIMNPDSFNPDLGFQRFKTRIKGANYDFIINGFSKTRTFRLSLLKIAAIIILALTIGSIFTYLFTPTDTTSLTNDIIVPLGSKTQVFLPDGSKIWLNSGSKLHYDFNFGKTTRNVYLEGEGYFSVAKNNKIPFIVKTACLDVKALGTEFNVSAYPGEKVVETVLVEGSVEIETTGDKSFNKKNNEVLLKPNQKLTFLKETNQMILYEKKSDSVQTKVEPERIDKITKIEKNQPVQKIVPMVEDPVIYTSWKDKRWIISKEELGGLSIKLERKYDVTIQFKNENLKQYRFSGILEDESIEQVLRAMSLTAPIKFSIDGKTVLLEEDANFLEKYKTLYKNK
jgi:transmembrane sensor